VKTAQADPNSLPERELQCLALCAAGVSTAEIGQQMYAAEDTVKGYFRRLFHRLGARNRAHMVALAYERGLLPDRNHPVRPAEPARQQTVVPEQPPVAARARNLQLTSQAAHPNA